jgi:hypothetical protein
MIKLSIPRASVYVKEDRTSEPFLVTCGTKQGGVLSPDFFSIYIDDLIKLLRKEGLGCYITRSKIVNQRQIQVLAHGL